MSTQVIQAWRASETKTNTEQTCIVSKGTTGGRPRARALKTTRLRLYFTTQTQPGESPVPAPAGHTRGDPCVWPKTHKILTYISYLYVPHRAEPLWARVLIRDPETACQLFGPIKLRSFCSLYSGLHLRSAMHIRPTSPRWRPLTTHYRTSRTLH